LAIAGQLASVKGPSKSAVVIVQQPPLNAGRVRRASAADVETAAVARDALAKLRRDLQQKRFR